MFTLCVNKQWKMLSSRFIQANEYEVFTINTHQTLQGNQPSMDWFLSTYRKHDTYDFNKKEPTTMFYQRCFYENFIGTP